MVVATENPNFLEASCCKVEVVKGGAGDFFAGLVSNDLIENSADKQEAKNSYASLFQNSLVTLLLKAFLLVN